MTPRQFSWLLGLHGADLSAWPDEAAARLLLRQSAVARAALADALSQDEAPAPDAPHLIAIWRYRMRGTTPFRTGLRWASLGLAVAAGLWLAGIMAPAVPDAFAIVQAGGMP